MSTHGLVARIDHGTLHHPWASRDYEEIDCQATGCRYNRERQCMVPSRCKISPEGRCEGFESPPLKKQVDGD